MYVFFGTRGTGPGVGISLAEFNPATGALGKPKFHFESPGPGYFILSRDGKTAYVCNSGPPHVVSALRIDPQTARLEYLNEKTSGTADAGFISMDKTGRFVLFSSYNGGNISIYAVEPDGSLGQRTAFIQHVGKSIHPQRQTKPYGHSIVTDPTNRFALVADLGLDKLFVHRFNEMDGTLTTNDPPFAMVKPGTGPRHVRCHPNGKWVYLINELANSIIAFNFDSVAGVLNEFQSISTLPDGFSGESACAELEVHPNGKFVYGSNRGHDSIAVFSVDQASGRLSAVQFADAGGQMPRNFALDPSGRWLICSNHASNNASVFRIDESSGMLAKVGDPVEVPSPHGVRFVATAKS